MEYAIGLAILGVMVGVVFRWKVLMPIIGVVLAASITFSISRGLSFLDGTLIVIVTQAALQCGYFVGLFIRLIIIPACTQLALWTSQSMHSRRNHEARRTDGSTLPQRPAKPHDLS
jgi:hypothetical protein